MLHALPTGPNDPASESDERRIEPATVVEVHAGGVVARLPSGASIEPRLALAYSFRPAVGDRLLVIGQDGRHYVIGVLESTGATHLAFRGDVDLRAVGGKIALSGDEGVEVRGPTIELTARRLHVLAEKATEVFGSVFTTVKDLWSVRSGSTDAVIHGEWSHRAEQASITTEEVVTINGREVHLG